MSESQLTECIGLPAAEVIQRLGVGDKKWSWADEPPGILRGVSYYHAGGRTTLYIAEGEPLFRRFNERLEWDYAAFLKCRVGGLQYTAGDLQLDVGPAVPWQFRRP